MTETITEDFPPLPFPKKETLCTFPVTESRRSSVCSISSVSTTSIGGETRPKSIRLAKNAICRRYLSCHCHHCNHKRNRFSGKCVDGITLRKGMKVKLLDQRRNRGTVFVLVVCTLPAGEGQFKGWVHPDSLGGLRVVERALVRRSWKQRKPKAKTQVVGSKKMTNWNCGPEIRVPRVEEPESSLKSPAPAAPFYKFRELVLCRTKLGAPFMVGEVLDEGLLAIRPHGWEKACVWDVRNVKKYPASKFVAVYDIPVRTSSNPKSFVKASLPKGTTLSVVEMKGFEGRITEPVCGYISMRTNQALNVIEENYQFEPVEPRVFIGNLPNDVDRATIFQGFREMREGLSPKTVELEVYNKNLGATIGFGTKAAGRQLVGRTINIAGCTVIVSWDIKYLRSVAGRTLVQN